MKNNWFSLPIKEIEDSLGNRILVDPRSLIKVVKENSECVQTLQESIRRKDEKIASLECTLKNMQNKMEQQHQDTNVILGQLSEFLQNNHFQISDSTAENNN